MKVNGKHQISDFGPAPSSLTLGAIDLKFGVADYVSGTVV